MLWTWELRGTVEGQKINSRDADHGYAVVPDRRHQKTKKP
jgi:hypothetical protein